MTSARLAYLSLGIAVFAGCYHGKNDVPRQAGWGGSGGTGTVTGATGGSATSSSGTTATTGTGGGGHGGGGTGGAPDPCANAIFCDDFESYPAGAPPGGMWGNNMNGGTVAVDGTHVHSGTKAAMMSADPTTTGYRSVMISLSDKSVLPVAGGVLYGRMMFWLDSAPIENVHWTYIAGSGLVPGQTYHAIYRYGGQLPLMPGTTFLGSLLMANYETPDVYQTPPVGPATDCWLGVNQEVVPVKTWTCAEWMFDTPNNTMRFWQNGTELKDLAMTGTGQGCGHQAASFVWSALSFERIDLGWESYQNDDARTIWIDDVALGAQRLGCPP